MKTATTTRDMTAGPIAKHLIAFSLPLMLGNIFQMLYNTVDSIVVGNYVGKEALAAVGSTSMIINLLVFFFNGFSIGAGVVIGRSFGAKDREGLHTAIQTTMTTTFIFCVLFTAIGVGMVKPMLRFMSTPEDVFDEAVIYLRIYFAGISGLLIYNMGSGILRAVGDTKRPLYFLILTSVLNIILDLFFVLVMKMGVDGVSLATILAQFISAGLTLRLLSVTDDIYRFSFKELSIDRKTLGDIFRVGLPAGIQSVITAFSNVFVQSYINYFGSGCMAGWSTYNKLDQFLMLPMQSTAMAATTFVSQNMGAGNEKRASKGAYHAILLSVGITCVIAFALFICARPAVSLFSKDQEVVDYGVLFIKANVFFLVLNAANHTMAGALRGKGDSTGPMVIMLVAFVAIRQIYLFVVTRWISNTPLLVGLGYPLGWASCFLIMSTYFYLRWTRKLQKAEKGIDLS